MLKIYYWIFHRYYQLFSLYKLCSDKWHWSFVSIFFIVFSNRCMFFCKEQSIYRGKWNRTGKFTLPKKNNAKETIPEEAYLVLISRQFQFVVVGVCQNMTLHKLAFKPLKFKEVKKKWLKKYLFTGFSWNRAWNVEGS